MSQDPERDQTAMRPAVIALALLSLAAAGSSARAQIVTGSDGSDGAFSFVPDVPGGSVMTVDLGLAATAPWNAPSPTAGLGVYDALEWTVVFKYSSITVPAGKTVRFQNHPARAPVVWLSQGPVVIDGVVDLSGADGHDWGELPSIAEPGPGGFRGGLGRQPAGVSSATAGFGPGGGALASGSVFGGSAAGHSEDGASQSPLHNHGKAYGTREIRQLIGGSGGAGHATKDVSGSGAGGGAFLIASDVSITIQGGIHADGGNAGAPKIPIGGDPGGPGSGGAIRLLSDTVTLLPGAQVTCQGVAAPPSSTAQSSPGRIRVEANAFDLQVPTSPPASLGVPAPVFAPPGSPAVRITQIDGVPVPADPRALLDDLNADVTLTDAGPKTLTIEADFVPLDWTVEVRLTDPAGDATVVAGTLVATADPNVAQATVSVNVPLSLSVIQVRVVEP